MGEIRRLVLSNYINTNMPASILNTDFTNDNGNTSYHTHEFYEFFIVTEGKVLHRHNSSEYEMYPLTAFFVSENDHHSIAKVKDCDKASIINVAFSRALLEEVVNYLDLITFNDLKEGQFIESTDRENLRIIINKLSILQNDVMLSYEKRLGLLKNILGDFIVELFENSRRNKISVPSWLYNACEHMKKKENYIQGLATFIRLTNKSQEHLTRQMKCHYRVTPTELINNIRLSEASKLLLNTNRSVLDIAYEVGFNNVSYFIRLFKRKYEICPSKYRKQVDIVL